VFHDLRQRATAGRPITTARTELDPKVFKARCREAGGRGWSASSRLSSVARRHWLLHWDVRPSWLAGVAAVLGVFL